MRRILTILGLTALMTTAPATAQDIGDRASCEWFCGSTTVSCYVVAGLIIGRDVCALYYEGCITGCYAALLDDD